MRQGRDEYGLDAGYGEIHVGQVPLILIVGHGAYAAYHEVGTDPAREVDSKAGVLAYGDSRFIKENIGDASDAPGDVAGMSLVDIVADGDHDPLAEAQRAFLYQIVPVA